MDTPFNIKPISAEETYAVRHPMLRQGRPIEDCVFKGDHKASTIHLGVFVNNVIVGVLSAYQKNHATIESISSYQIRGVAVFAAEHRKGIGKALMKHAEQLLTHKGIDLIWLNARINAIDFYKSLAYSQEGDAFNIAGIGTHYCFYKKLK